jgi:hypothetical protein
MSRLLAGREGEVEKKPPGYLGNLYIPNTNYVTNYVVAGFAGYGIVLGRHIIKGDFHYGGYQAPQERSSYRRHPVTARRDNTGGRQV